MINRIEDIIEYQYKKYNSNNKQIFFIPLNDDSESELIEKPLVQGYYIDLKKNSLKKSYDLTDITITNTGDMLNDLCNLLTVVSKLSPKMLKSIFLYEKSFVEFNKSINSFKSTVLAYDTVSIPLVENHNKFLFDKIVYFIERAHEINDVNNTSEKLIDLSIHIRRIRETKIIFDDYYNTCDGDKTLEKELNSIRSMFNNISNLALTTLKTTRYFV